MAGQNCYQPGSLIVPSPLPKEAGFGFLGIWLGVTAAVCLGFALQGWANQGARHRGCLHSAVRGGGDHWSRAPRDLAVGRRLTACLSSIAT